MKGYCKFCGKVYDEVEHTQFGCCVDCYNETEDANKKVEYGEKCIKCGLGIMLHTEVYVYKCSKCSYEYTIDPNAPRGSETIKERFITEELND